ncbi:prenyltransferase/squalene oxidase repeat-containing protein [Blastopirellula marina]|uniref:Squalene-hopene-cyclase-like protein n=1 Tax=Blastopirellula marina DSM 3645 TaxID=314230 RepID=A3ZPL8_9BACT|nr:prenyltransferase/squalene oxidase repeat-containing protein [Blastopirellula marina]EAQ81696.1 squalene-hopene-cyclase-like protein [Blastopirellula marina DSM 3645]
MSSEEHPKDRNKSPEKRPAPISQPPTQPTTPPPDGEETKAPISFGQTPPQSAPNYFPPHSYPQPGQFGPAPSYPPPQYPPSQYPPPGQGGPPQQYPPAGQYPAPPVGPYQPPSYPNPWPVAPTAPVTPQPPAAPPSEATPTPPVAQPAPQQPPAKAAAPKLSTPNRPPSKPPTSPGAKKPPAAKTPTRDSGEKPDPPKWKGEAEGPAAGEKKRTAKSDAVKNASSKPQPKKSPSSAAAKPDKSAPVKRIPADRKGLPQQAPKRTAPAIVDPQLKVAEHTAPAEDLTAKSTKLMPPWMVSTIVHFLLVIALAMFAFTPRQNQTVVVTATYAEKLGEQLDQPFVLDEADLMEDDVTGFDITLFESEEPPPASLTTLAATGTKSRQSEIETPGVEYNFRSDGGGKKALLKAYGGSATTEQAVKEALDWLKRNQRRDGSWSLKGPYRDGAGIENHVAATAMALLAFQGAGHTTLVGAYTKEVSRGWDFLLSQMDNDGTFISGPLANQHRLYTQAQATIALCELYGMTHDEQYKKPAQRAIDYAVRIQSPEGGWRYTPGDGADTSVTGWFVIAFASAQMCGLSVPEDTLQRVGGFLDSVSKENGARYTYQPTRNQPPTLSMTAEGLLCRQYLGWTQEDPRLSDGVDFLVGNPISWTEPDVYYWYYGTQVAHHYEGAAWQEWNKVMRQAIPEQQVKVGGEKGSWSPDGDKHGVIGGRLFMTCLCVYMLEVYYRHLPIYSKSEVLSLQ